MLLMIFLDRAARAATDRTETAGSIKILHNRINKKRGAPKASAFFVFE